MHVQQSPRAAPLMQIVNILRYEQEIVSAVLHGGFQCSERDMRRIGRDPRKGLPPRIIKFMHQGRIGGEAFRRGNLFYAVIFPKPVACAKSLDAAFCADSRAGQYNDRLDAHA